MTSRLTRTAALLGLAAATLTLPAAAPGAEEPWEFVHWAPLRDGPVFTGAGGDAWDRKIRERGFILFDRGSYHLWYTGYNDDRSPLRRLGHATSPDGLAWTRDPANPVGPDLWTEDVFVARVDAGLMMLAEGKNDVAHLLESRDPVSWREVGPLDVRKADGTPIPPGPYGTPCAWDENGTRWLFYERGDLGVWAARGTGPNRWVNVRDEPVIGLGPDPYDRGAVALNQVVKRGGYYYGFYHAAAERPWKEWTSNVARSRDLVHWEKYPGNPVVKNNCSSPVLVTGPDGDRLYTMHPEVRVFRPAKPTQAGGPAPGRP